jgi:hypothetical protein
MNGDLRSFKGLFSLTPLPEICTFWLLRPLLGTLIYFTHFFSGFFGTFRNKPFDAVELEMGLLLGDDPE